MAMLVYQPVSTFGLDSGIWFKIHSSSIIQAIFSFRTPLSLVVKTEGFHASCPYLGHAPCLLVHATYFYLVDYAPGAKHIVKLLTSSYIKNSYFPIISNGKSILFNVPWKTTQSIQGWKGTMQDTPTLR